MSTDPEENPPPLAAAAAAQQQVAHQAAAQVAERRAGHVVHQSAALRAAAEDRRQHFGDVRRLGILEIKHRVVAGRAAAAFGDRGEQLFKIVERFEVVRGDQHAAGAGGDDDRRPGPALAGVRDLVVDVAEHLCEMKIAALARHQRRRLRG